MKVILLSDVKDVGKKDEVVEVSDGYGRNFLIRRGLAVMATGGSLEVLAEEAEEKAEKKEESKQKAIETKNKIEAIELDFTVNVGVEGKIFGSVSSKQVARALLQRHKIKVDRRKFLDNGPYNHLGVNNVKVELFKDVVATIQVVLKEKK